MVPTTADVSGLLFLYLFCAAAEITAAQAEIQATTTVAAAASAKKSNFGKTAFAVLPFILILLVL